MRVGLAAVLSVFTAGWAFAQDTGPISAQRMSDVVKVIASDAFEGRSPGTPGEDRTVAYLVDQFRAIGLEPAGDKGGWTQAVPMVRFNLKPGASIGVSAGGDRVSLRQGQEVMLMTQRPVDRVKVAAAPLVFAGCGVKAPERGWDDFKGYDFKGKVMVVLVNDPDFEASAADDAHGRFGGKAMTYYGRWTYKFEEAARQGALGVLIVHDTPGAGYAWSTVQASNAEAYDVARSDPARAHALIEGWIQHDAAADLFRRAGLDLDRLKADARRRDFRPVPLGGEALFADYGVEVKTLTSHNVIGKLTGTTRPKQGVIFAAHWDAFGVGAADASGDRIRHGAADDGTGVAGVLELARAFAHAPRPARTTVFALWTGEERGLLGSEWNASHPTLDPALTAADFTMDTLQPMGASRDVVLVGAGQNQLEDLLAQAAASQGRTITPDSHPERGLFYRADHFSLAKRGVPTLLLMSLGGGPDLVKGGRAAGDAWITDFTARCYHQPCDVWRPDWDLTGAAQDVDLLYQVGRDLASSGAWPEWKSGSEFADLRTKSRSLRPDRPRP